MPKIWNENTKEHWEKGLCKISGAVEVHWESSIRNNQERNKKRDGGQGEKKSIS